MRDEMRYPAKVVSQILLKVAEHVRPGISTFVLDCIAEEEIKKHGVYSYNKNYHPEWAMIPFPSVMCISVNDIIAHGIPSDQIVLSEGDTVNLDMGIIDKDGNCGDAALTLPVGEISEKDKMLLRYAKKTTFAGIDVIKDGVYIHEIAMAMWRKADERKFVINHQLASHAIGKKMHETPVFYNVPNHNASRGTEEFLEYQKIMDIQLTEGMVVCLEPLLTFQDKWGVLNPQTGWEFRTRDRQKSAMFEHMVLVTKDGHEILTDHFSLDSI